ncbi:MAG: hypothetical protein CFK52_07440 [Chloracidobacterium sp. CP2_5A]|nr:MAG: hypothetical protein CFK52_07440 [Chloracidobacterium sp. CP2_5A]
MREILEPIAHRLQSPQDLDQVLSAVAQRAAEGVTAVCARLWLIRRGDLCQTCRWAEACPDKRRCLHLKANFGIPVEASYRRAPLAALSSEQLARGGVVAWSPPPSAGAMLLDPQLADEQGVVSFIAHPLRVENRVLGLLAVFGARMFTAADFEDCAAQAAAASAAIRVAELANRVQRADAAARDKSREAEQQSRLLTAILTHSADRAIVVEDLEGNILAFNEGARRAYGYAPEEVIGRAMADKLHAPDDWRSGKVSTIYQQALEQGAYAGEMRRQRQDGQVFAEYATLNPLRDEEGDPAGFIAIAPVAPESSLAGPAETILAALEELAGVRRLEDFAPETLTQMCRMSGAVGAALLTLDGDALSVRAIQGEAAFAAGLSDQKFWLGDAPELFRALEHGQVEPLSGSAAKWLTDAAAGGLIVPMLRQPVQSVAILAAPRRTDGAALLRLARIAAALLKWQLLYQHLEGREQALASEEAARQSQREQLAREHEAAVAKAVELERQLASAGDAARQSAEARQAAEAQAAGLASKLEALEAERARLAEVSRQSEADAEQARRAMAEAAARCESLSQGQAAALRERDLFKARVELLEADLRQTRQRADRSAHQYAEALARLHELEGRVTSAEQARAAAEQDLAEAQRRYEASHRHLLERSLQLETLLAKSQETQVAQEAEIERLAAQLTALAEETAKAHQSRLDAQRLAEAVRQDLEAAQALLTEAIARSQTAERKAAEIEERAAKLLSEVIASQEDQARLIKDYERLEAELAVAGEAAARQSQTVALLEAHIDKLEQSVAASEVSRAALAQRLEALLEERAAWRETIDRLEARLADSRVTAATGSVASPGETEATIAKLQAALAQREKEAASLRQRVSILQGAYRDTVAALQSRLDDLAKLNAITGAHRKLEDVLLSAPAAETSPAVIVACDDDGFRATLAEWCQQSGYQVSQAGDGDATLAALLLDPPRGIVLAGTPAHIGETYRRVRRNPDWRALPVVVVTPESFAGVSASPATVILAQRAAAPAALRQALLAWSAS